MADVPQPPPIRPMSRGASRLFVIAAVLFILVAAVGSAWYLTRSALDNQERIQANTEAADSSAVRGFGVTNY